MFAFAFCHWDGKRNFSRLATHFRCGPFVVLLGFLISQCPRLFNASCYVVEGHLEEAVTNTAGNLLSNAPQIFQVGGGWQNILINL